MKYPDIIIKNNEEITLNVKYGSYDTDTNEIKLCLPSLDEIDEENMEFIKYIINHETMHWILYNIEDEITSEKLDNINLIDW